MYQNSKITPPPISNTVTSNQEDTIDLRKILMNVVHHWTLFISCIIVCCAIAFVFAYRSIESWQVASKILIKDDKGGAGSVMGGSFGGDIGSIFNAKSNADNEIQILKSRTLMQKTVRSMQLNVRTFKLANFKSKELYEEAPFDVILDYKSDTLKVRDYYIKILNNKEYSIENSKEKVDQTAKFGQVVHLKQYNFALKLKSLVNVNDVYDIYIEDNDATIEKFSETFAPVLSDKQASTIDLSFTYQHPAKGEAILNRLMQLYLSSNVENEKQIADSTYAFINSRIELVSKELNDIEKQFEKYKTQNSLANIGEQSKALIASASGFYDKLSERETQLSIIVDLEKYLNNPKNKKAIPSSLVNPTDQAFGQAINSYNDLLRSRDRATLSYTDDNPIIQNLDVQIENTRSNLLRNIQTYKQTLQVGRNQLEKENSSLAGQLKQMPAKERNYLDFSRQQNLKQELYLYLLQKREETAISRNSTIATARVVDFAKSGITPYAPKRSLIYLIGIIAGVLLAALYLFIAQLINTRINSKNDIENATPVVILGEIGHNPDKQNLVTGKNSRSVISEQFRSLRTNLQFILTSSKSNTILFTSSMSGEGKSFLSLNLGSALALADKKVVFLEMDLRKPKLSESLGLTIENGFTNYAMSEGTNYNFKKLLKPLGFSDKCFLISSGPIPPNPAELLMSDRLEVLMSYLRIEFDYIIIDCAPVGLVTDALILEKFADMTLYVTRQNFTYKSQLNILNELVMVNNVKNIYLIVNDIKLDKTGNSGYKQSYGYGIEEEANWIDNLKFWKRN